MDNWSDQVDFYLGDSGSAAKLETLHISQPSFSREYRFQPYYRDGLWLRDESGEQQFFEWMPMQLRPMAEMGDLDFGISVTFGDLGEVLPAEIARARQAGTLRTHPAVVVYRVYRSDRLDRPMYGPLRLEAPTIVRGQDGAQFEARARSLNISRTGMLYRTDLFPGLLGFL
ncbi:Uncharacterised protein [Bordetella ansorpii]|uniref:DUF1833 domain-containing protein n=1 Tax=Bordetella ansorpii TaxID=288768 RepID=A0A157RLZ1_9BORD|nr:hypothetical protein [Bordetella ansorpii]SAI58904.1 Uncharacterised protein [Bordetella ansorpii]